MTPLVSVHLGRRAVSSVPLISVIVATYNSRATLACALDSVRRQDFQDFEVWVVGDACTDGSHEVVEALGDPRFHWINRETNSGIASRRRTPTACGRRSGRYVAYLGHDDLWFPWHLSTLVAAIERDDAAFAHGLGVLLGPDDRLLVAGPPPRGLSYARHFVAPTNWLHRRDLLDPAAPSAAAGGVRRTSTAAVDSDVLWRIAASGAIITAAPRLTTIKFPSPWWRLDAPGSPRPQPAMHDELMRDPSGLAERLLTAIATEHARTRNSRVMRPSDLLREAAWLRAPCDRHVGSACRQGADHRAADPLALPAPSPEAAPAARLVLRLRSDPIRSEPALAWNTGRAVVSKCRVDLVSHGGSRRRGDRCWNCGTSPSASPRVSRSTTSASPRAAGRSPATSGRTAPASPRP